MTPEEARRLLDDDPDLRGSHRLAVSVLIEEAVAAERRGWAEYFEGLADEYFDTDHGIWGRLKMVAARIREGGAG